ncbi:hypothetical protein [Ammoniphilus resinae]|uniref:DUF2262 domain-containing protein n=1 Tax=Ammoniphilus resinae TaxID=861532 RepID=A0ABS4GV60_9BACL|nr:hypothetical protein [Ammoniphilus resinae]MBP1933937.1 hypothetical protein [Ammoniphilus resinae]
MSDIQIQPELRTAGGEALSIHRDGEWIGDVYLIYRESDWLTGTIHLDEEYVDEEEIEEIASEIQPYITNLSFALNIVDYAIHLYHGQYSLLEDYFDEGLDDDEIEILVEDEKEYERWIVGQGEQGIEYQIYDEEKNLVAEAVVDIQGTRIVGEINFSEDPSEEEMENIEALLLKDYDHELIDQYNFTYFINGTEYQEVEIETDVDEIPIEEVQLLERIGLESDDEVEENEKVEVVYDLVDPQDHQLAEATFIYSEDGVDINVELMIKPTEDTTYHLMQQVFKEALTAPIEWVNIRMYHNGKVVDGFHFERGKEMSPFK